MSEIAQPVIEIRSAHGSDFAHFVVEPLDKGFGTTLGNALRRVLLSSLPGAAVTQVRIEGVQHEFSPLPKAKEDTIDFLLNLKGLRLKAVSGRPGRLILDVKGKRKVTAGDIEPSSDFTVANPDLYLLTMDDKDAHFYVEMDVEIDRGYRLADSKENPTVGTIPQDAIFSPVEKVNYTTEPVHLGQETSYERLHLQVWTDGTVSPSEAVVQSANILLKQFAPFASLGGMPFPISEKRVEKLTIPEEKFNMPIEQLDLSVRSLNCLRHAGITTVGEVMTKGIDELMGLRNFGLKSLNELEERLQVFGLSLNQPGESAVAPVEEEEKKPKRKRAQAAVE